MILEGGQYERVSPISIGEPDSRFDPPRTVRWDGERVIFLEGCRYWGGYGGAIVAHDDRILAELSPDLWGVQRHALLSTIKLPSPTRLEGLTAIVSTPESDSNFSHWMVDLLPRFALLAAAGFGPEKVDRYLINVGAGKYCMETLAQIGIPAAKIVKCSKRTHLICDAAVTTSLRAEHWQYSMPFHTPETLKRLLIPGETAMTGPGTKIYIRRGNAAHRRVMNEDVIVPQLRDYGFVDVALERMSVMDQVACFRNADLVVAAHGSGLTNLAFCRPGTTVVETHARDYFDRSFWTMATAVGCRYFAEVSRRPGRARPLTIMEARRQGLYLDLKSLLRMK